MSQSFSSILIMVSFKFKTLNTLWRDSSHPFRHFVYRSFCISMVDCMILTVERKSKYAIRRLNLQKESRTIQNGHSRLSSRASTTAAMKSASRQKSFHQYLKHQSGQAGMQRHRRNLQSQFSVLILTTSMNIQFATRK